MSIDIVIDIKGLTCTLKGLLYRCSCDLRVAPSDSPGQVTITGVFERKMATMFYVFY